MKLLYLSNNVRQSKTVFPVGFVMVLFAFRIVLGQWGLWDEPRTWLALIGFVGLSILLFMHFYSMAALASKSSN